MDKQNPILQCRHIINIEPAGEQEVWNIGVTNTHVYIAEGILTQNCLDSVRYALGNLKVNNAIAAEQSIIKYKVDIERLFVKREPFLTRLKQEPFSRSKGWVTVRNIISHLRRFFELFL